MSHLQFFELFESIPIDCGGCCLQYGLFVKTKTQYFLRDCYDGSAPHLVVLQLWLWTLDYQNIQSLH